MEARVVTDIWRDLKAVHAMALRLCGDLLPTRGVEGPAAPNDARKAIMGSLDRLSSNLSLLQELTPSQGDLSFGVLPHPPSMFHYD